MKLITITAVALIAVATSASAQTRYNSDNTVYYPTINELGSGGAINTQPSAYQGLPQQPINQLGGGGAVYTAPQPVIGGTTTTYDYNAGGYVTRPNK